MKTKKALISVFTLCTAFMLTACGGKDTVSTEKPQDIQTEVGTEKPQELGIFESGMMITLPPHSVNVIRIGVEEV